MTAAVGATARPGPWGAVTAGTVSPHRGHWGRQAGSPAPRGCGTAVARGCPGKPGLSVDGWLPGWLPGSAAAAGAYPLPRPHVRGGCGRGEGGWAAALSQPYSGGESVPAASEDVSPFQNELYAVEVGYARTRVCSRHCSAGKVRRRH